MMGQSFKWIDRIAVAVTQRVIQFRWWVVLLALISAIGVGSGARYLEFANNYRVFFSDENPELTAFENLQATYTKNDNFLFVLEPRDQRAFSEDTLTAVELLTEAAWKIPYAIRVDSVSNFQHTYGVDDDLIVEDLVTDAYQMDALERSRRASVAQQEPLLRNQLVTANGHATAINVVLQYPEKSLEEVPDAVRMARELRAQIEQAFPEINVSLTGVSMLNNAFMEAGMADMGALIPAMFVLILVLTLAILRSVPATLATLALIMFSTMVGMGAAGFLGIKLTPISGSAPIVILTLAIADSIHILISLRTAMREGMSKRRAIVEALRLNFMPVSITSLTTIIGFLALNFSDSPPFWHLGNITAVGIFAAWMFSLTLLPALISILPYRQPGQASGRRGDLAMERLANFVIRQPGRLVTLLGAASLALIAFIPSLDLNDQWTRYFDQRIEFRRDTDQALNHFGMYPIEYSVPARQSGGISDPDYLENLERLTDFLRDQPEVVHVYSLSDIMKRLNKNLHGDDDRYYKTPEDRDLSAQYLLLYELSLPYGLDLNDRINIDKSATRVTATLGDVDSIQTKRLLKATDVWMTDNLPKWMHSKPTSAQVMFTYIADRNVDNMVGGTLAAIGAIAVILMVALRSVRLGLLSLVPNGLPILTTFGAWSLLVGEVGFSVATVASISLGIVVDDTVHLLSKYVRARQEQGLNTADSIRYAFRSVGVALLVNTVILSAGFLVLLTSSFKINADMGLLTSMAIVSALILDFLFLPALLLLIDRRSPDVSGDLIMNTNPNPAQAATNAASLLLVASLALSPLAFEPALASNLTEVRGDTEPERQGFEVAARSDRTDRGFSDSQVTLEMVLRNAAGKESRRNLSVTTLEVVDEGLGDKSLVVFDSPRDIEGTALLSHAQILDPDDQWLFLPALKRVKRIASANKSGPFVGSEFAFEDFTSLELNKYDYQWLSEESCERMICDVVERIPRYANSGYTRQLAWVDQTVFQIRKVEFYDRRGDLLKTLELKEYRQYQGIWRAHRLEMVNHQTGKSTDLIYGDFRFGVGVSDNDFVKGRLTRLR
jgi:predicted RND superfamily exporter protein/outer membrane lipoprotein-sorting protein